MHLISSTEIEFRSFRFKSDAVLLRQRSHNLMQKNAVLRMISRFCENSVIENARQSNFHHSSFLKALSRKKTSLQLSAPRLDAFLVVIFFAQFIRPRDRQWLPRVKKRAHVDVRACEIDVEKRNEWPGLQSPRNPVTDCR